MMTRKRRTYQELRFQAVFLPPYSYYRFKELYEKAGEEGLKEISRKKPILKNRVDEVTEQKIVEFAIDYPAFGQLRASNELKKQAVIISPAGVRNVMKKRLEARVAQDGIILSESQLAAMEKAKAQKEAEGGRRRNRDAPSGLPGVP